MTDKSSRRFEERPTRSVAEHRSTGRKQASSATVAIRRVGLASLARSGCLVGAVAALLPSLICGLAALVAMNAVRGWMESWQSVALRLFGQEVASFDLVSLLSLERVLHALRVIDAASVLVAGLAVVALALVGGALVAAVVVLVGLAFNWVSAATGGIVVQLVEQENRNSIKTSRKARRP